MKKFIIFTLLIAYALAVPLNKRVDKDDDELTLDDVPSEPTQKPRSDKKAESFIQKIPKRGSVKYKPGEELDKCLHGEPDEGHPHLVKTDIEDVAEVLITHTKTKPEHEHKFDDIPDAAQTEAAVSPTRKQEPTKVKTTKATTPRATTPKPTTAKPTTKKEEVTKPSFKLDKRVSERPKPVVLKKELVKEEPEKKEETEKKDESAKKEDAVKKEEPEKKEEADKKEEKKDDDDKKADGRKKRHTVAETKTPSKIRPPKLKTGEKKKVAEPKPEPIPIALHEVAGFEKIAKKSKRDVDSQLTKREGFVRPKPVSEILKHHAIQPVQKDDPADEEFDEEEEEHLPIENRREPPKPSKASPPKKRT